MNGDDGYFKNSDLCVDVIADFTLPDRWWSRKYEYPWALQYVKFSDVVADIGSGEYYRPFKDALASICKKTYAIDLNPNMESKYPITYISADFTKRIEELDDESLDKVFCISVLEECEDIEGALYEFYRLLKNGGQAIITMDVQYNPNIELTKYKAVDLKQFYKLADTVGFYIGLISRRIDENIIFNDELNLCCYHTVLRKNE